MDLSSCLEIRSTPYVASSAITLSNGHSRKPSKEGVNDKRWSNDDDFNDEDEEDLPEERFNLVGRVDELIAATDLDTLQSNREFLNLPRFCVEVLHASKEEADAVQPQPLCKLVLEWAHRKWLDDNSVQILEDFVEKSTLLIMNKENRLQDGKEVEEGSEHDSDLIQDYKKSNPHLEKSKKVVGRRKMMNPSSVNVQPAKPKERLYTRHINHDDAARTNESAEEFFWKVIVAHRLDSRSIMGVVSLDGKVLIMSIMQRINVTNNSPTMIRSVSEGSLKGGLKSPVDGSKASRPPSLDKDVYVPVASMKYAKCASGVVSFQNRLVVCGGFDRGECLNKVEAYDHSYNLWEKWPSMLCKRGRFDATTVEVQDGKTRIYAVGGSNGHAEEASLEIYDPEVGKWTSGPSLPIALSNIGKPGPCA